MTDLLISNSCHTTQLHQGSPAQQGLQVESTDDKTLNPDAKPFIYDQNNPPETSYLQTITTQPKFKQKLTPTQKMLLKQGLESKVTCYQQDKRGLILETPHQFKILDLLEKLKTVLPKQTKIILVGGQTRSIKFSKKSNDDEFDIRVQLPESLVKPTDLSTHEARVTARSELKNKYNKIITDILAQCINKPEINQEDKLFSTVPIQPQLATDPAKTTEGLLFQLGIKLELMFVGPEDINTCIFEEPI